jgi:hypothetical protein
MPYVTKLLNINVFLKNYLGSLSYEVLLSDKGVFAHF